MKTAKEKQGGKGELEPVAPEAASLAGTHSVDKALQVLLQIAESPPPGLTLATCASILGYSKPTTLRILRTLERREFLHFDDELGVYALGLATAQLGSVYLDRLDLRRAALPHMTALVRDTAETGHLGVLSGTDVVYIELVDSPHPVRIFSRVGDTVPAYATATGKALLAWKEPDLVGRHLPDHFVPRTANTIGTVDDLMRDLAITRKRGYAVDNAENREGIRGFAAPIFDFSGSVVAAVAVGGPVMRIPESREVDFGRRVIDTAADISRTLGAPVKGIVANG